MQLRPGTRVGTYELVGLLGAGGMGEVYRARDAKLNRDVALKTLPEAFALDPERLTRFNREAQVLAFGRLLRRCLAKNPRERLHHMSDVRLEIADALQPLSNTAPQSARVPAVPRSRFAAAVTAALLVGGAVAATIAWFVVQPPAPSVTRLSIGLSGAQAVVVGGLDRDLALSPDGTRLVYIGSKV